MLNAMSSSAPAVHCMKVAVLGDQAVGKTSAVRAFSRLTFEQQYHESTDVRIWDALLPAGPSDDSGGGSAAAVIRSQFWDCGTRVLDDERLRRLLDGALCVLLVYDVTDRSSFDNVVSKWLDAVQVLAPDAFLVLVGNKSDQGKKRAVQIEEVEDFASANNLFFMEMSAKTNENVELTLSILRIRAKHTMNAEVSASVNLGFEEPFQDPPEDSRRSVGSFSLSHYGSGKTIGSAGSAMAGGEGIQNLGHERSERGVSTFSEAARLVDDTTGSSSAAQVPIASISLNERQPMKTQNGVTRERSEQGNLGADQGEVTISSILGRPQRREPSRVSPGSADDVGFQLSAQDLKEAEELQRLNINSDLMSASSLASMADSALDGAVAGDEDETSANLGGARVSGDRSRTEFDDLSRLVKGTLHLQQQLREVDVGNADEDGEGRQTQDQEHEIEGTTAAVDPGNGGFQRRRRRRHENGESASASSQGGLTNLRVHRTGSISFSREGDNDPVRISRAASAQGDQDSAMQLKWHRKGSVSEASSETSRRSIRPDEMTLHERPTASYRRKLAEEDEHGRRRSAILKSSKAAPDLFVDINLEGKRVGTIAVREGDNPGVLASEFVRKHNLDASLTQKLTRFLRQRVAEFHDEHLERSSESASRQSRDEIQRLRTTVVAADAPKLHASRSSRAGSTGSFKNRALLGTLHVKVGKGRIGKLVVREGDDPKRLVSSFRKTYGLRAHQASQIEERILVQLEMERSRKVEEERQRRETQDFAEQEEDDQEEEQKLRLSTRDSGSGLDGLDGLDTQAWVGMRAHDRLPSPIRYPSVLTIKQRELLRATLGGGGGGGGGGSSGPAQVDPPIPPRAPPPVPSEAGTLATAIPRTRKMLFNLDVNIGQGRVERIQVKEDDDLELLAESFCKRFGLSEHKVSRVSFLLEEKLMMHHRHAHA